MNPGLLAVLRGLGVVAVSPATGVCGTGWSAVNPALLGVVGSCPPSVGGRIHGRRRRATEGGGGTVVVPARVARSRPRDGREAAAPTGGRIHGRRRRATDV